VDFNYVLPKPELLSRDGVEKGSEEWRMQLYGAALYWYAATTPRGSKKHGDLDMLRGKDVLEVACMRGGGARYLAEVVAPRSYVAIDNVEEHLDACRKHSHPNLRYELADALSLSMSFSPASFDVVLGIQAVAKFADIPLFIHEAAQLLRPGGRLIICDAFVRDKFKVVLDSLEVEQLRMDDTIDLSRAVHAVGLCKIPAGISYLHIVASKPEIVTESINQPENE
jgi:ubiquinone/menaquinone biosynthesis C-methylase UbiE